MRTAHMGETLYGDVTFNRALWGVAYMTTTSICYQYVIHSHKGSEVAVKVSLEHKLWTKNAGHIQYNSDELRVNFVMSLVWHYYATVD